MAHLPIKFSVSKPNFAYMNDTAQTSVERLSSFYAKRGKYLLDFVAAFFLILIFAPLMILISILIKLSSRGPIFFSHKRVGINNKLFVIHKFRSLHIDTPSYSEKPDSTEDVRITAVGKWIRKTSLDELPQLFNVIKGEMSLVGPRPEMPFLAENYEDWENQRHLVRPGMTGLWQLSPRRRGSIREGIPVDLEYIENLSLWNDFKILLRTFKVFWDDNTY
ncbi:MAG: sugar transferase [Candidatus Poribacteria bacterium]|nr:sugar transferase [Candidatus Poribacteria bacterium]MDE0316746.1 sugar transferase [Candidatus Poribacteria bacterium]